MGGDDHFCVVTHREDYPVRPDPPTTFLIRIDDSKDDPQGRGAPRAVCAAPPGSLFCLVSRIFACLKRFPALVRAACVGDAGQLVSQTPRGIVQTGLDPTRLMPHSARVAAVIQLARHTKATQLRQGN